MATTLTQFMFAMARLRDATNMSPHKTLLVFADLNDVETVVRVFEPTPPFEAVILTDAQHINKDEEPYINPKSEDVLNDKTLTDEEEMEEMPRIVSCLAEIMREVVGEDWIDDFCSVMKKGHI